MANTHTTLSSLFTDIANAIRSKTGKTTSIIADDFPDEIASITGGSGNATDADVLSGKTYSNDSGSSTGTMPNNGAISETLEVNGTYTIPAGYHNGSGKVTQSLTTKSATTYTPGDSVQTIYADQYLTGDQTISAVSTQTKTATANGIITPDSGKYLSSVVVAISEYADLS